MPLVIIKQHKPPKKRRVWPVWLAALLIISLAINYMRPLPLVRAQVLTPAVLKAESVQLDWPTAGYAAVGAEGFGLLASTPNQPSIATASIAKVITALSVLQKYPLHGTEQGPTIIMSDADVAIYNNYASLGGSVVPVVAGEQITEYEMLEGMMLPSANNFADSLAIWVFGSLASYKTYAQQFLQQHNLTGTQIGSDASGFDANTTSTAVDLVQLGLLAAQDSALAAIVQQPQATLPEAGVVTNYDTVLGEQGINGFKTGNNDADPGAFLFTAKVPIGSSNITVVGTILGQNDLEQALQAAPTLIISAQKDFAQTTVATAGQIVGQYVAPWGAKANAVVLKNVSLVHWKADSVDSVTNLNALTAGNSSKTTIGSLTARSGPNKANSVVQLDRSLTSPSFWWRLTRF